MIKIKIVCVGKIKDAYLNQGISEFVKRLNGYCNLEIVEVKDEKIVANTSEEKILEIEGNRILEKVNDKDYMILLDLRGKQFSSEEFAEKLDSLISSGVGNYAFVIGGSLGQSENVRKRANLLISFSRLTFTHQMIRLLLLEQIYRGFKINNNETYHK